MNAAACNQFKPEHLKKEEIDLIVKAGLAAPSGHEPSAATICCGTESEVVKKLSAMNAAVMGRDGDPFYGAPDVIIVLVEKSGSTYVQDGSLALGNMLNAAYAMGLGGRWINRAKEMFESAEGKALLKEWGVEGDLEGIGCCILGYPGYGPLSRRRRYQEEYIM